MKNLDDVYKKSIEKELKKIDETGVNKTISKRKKFNFSIRYSSNHIVCVVLCL